MCSICSGVGVNLHPFWGDNPEDLPSIELGTTTYLTSANSSTLSASLAGTKTVSDSGNQIIDGIVYGKVWSSNSMSSSFPTNPGELGTATVDALINKGGTVMESFDRPQQIEMALVSIDGHKAHKIVDGGVSFSRLIADREFSTATPSSPGAVPKISPAFAMRIPRQGTTALVTININSL